MKQVLSQLTHDETGIKFWGHFLFKLVDKSIAVCKLVSTEIQAIASFNSWFVPTSFSLIYARTAYTCTAINNDHILIGKCDMDLLR